MTNQAETDSCVTPPAATGTVAIPDDDTLAALAKASAHPARIRILRFLAEQQACITGDIVTELDLAQSTVSEHLRILREAGLIHGEIEGPRTRYCLNPNGLTELALGIDAITRPRSRVRG
jgi:ArsR family transcriptional regulator